METRETDDFLWNSALSDLEHHIPVMNNDYQSFEAKSYRIGSKSSKKWDLSLPNIILKPW